MKQVASGDRAGAEERAPSVAPSPRYRVCPKGDKMSRCIKNKRVPSFRQPLPRFCLRGDDLAINSPAKVGRV